MQYSDRKKEQEMVWPKQDIQKVVKLVDGEKSSAVSGVMECLEL